MPQTSAARVALRAGPVVVLLAGLALAAGACGDKKPGTGVASLPKGSTSTSASAGKAQSADMLKYAQCMRSHGITKFPDPGADGSLRFEPGLGLDPNSDQFKAATEACKSLAPPAQNPPEAKKADPQEQQKFLAFAKCMREHGISNYPDPKINGNGALDLLLPKGIDINSPQFKAAEQACTPLLPDGGQPPGAGS
jgi:hypothetical protein